MSSLNFPPNPNPGDTWVVGGITYYWNGYAWLKGSGAGIVATTGIFTSNVNATSTNSGALKVTGGLGIGGDLWVGGALYIAEQAVLTTSSFAYSIDEGPDIDISLSSSSGALVFSNTSNLQSVTGRGNTTANPIIITTTTNASNATTGALIVTGGIGVGGNLYSNGIINGNIITARNLSPGRVVLVGSGGQLTDDAELTYNTVTNTLSVVSLGAGTASNLSGGGPGMIPYQSAASTTFFISTGTSGYVLQSNGTSAPSWVSAAGLTPGAANTATTISGGTAGQVLYQSTSGVTAFTGPGTSGNVLVSRGTGGPVFQNTLTLAGTTNASSTQSGALQVLGGVGVARDIVVGGSLTVGQTALGQVVPVFYSNNVMLASYSTPVITSLGTVTVDTYSASTYRTARYTIQVFDQGKVHCTEIMVSHNNTNVIINEYGIMTTAGELGTFSAVLISGEIFLTFTPTAATAMTIKAVRLGITA